VSRPRIAVVGGGFAGVYTALALEKALARKDDFDLVLVNKENYFVFQPMLPEVLSGSIGILDVVSPIRRLLPRTELHVREVESIDLAGRQIRTAPGFRPQPHVIPYDHLVLALGTVTDFRGLRGLPEHALPFKNLGDALHLRNHVIHALEEAAIEREPALRRELLTFVVAGGGFSGVEVTAELNDFVRGVARSYRGLDPSEIRVLLVHSGERILPEVSEKLALFAQRILQGRGVELRLSARLEAATGDEAVLKGGERVPSRTLISTVPSFPHPLIETLDLPKSKTGRLLVDRELRVEGSDHVWALGDAAAVPTSDGSPSPPTAQHATRQAEVAAHNLLSTLRGGSRRTFDFKGLGKMGSLGHRSAVAEVFGFQISGFPAWWLWRTIYLLKLPGWGRRLKVATSWTLDVLLPPELVQLKLGGTRGIQREHFEPGQEVFRQGELGDRIYIILDGRVEVVREERGEPERRLAELGPGESFGEMALLNKSTRTATVRCLDALDVLSLPKGDFAALTSNLPDLRKSFEGMAHSRERALRSEPPTS
jgi:NADH:quinone reductase (non-electrogenic)